MLQCNGTFQNTGHAEDVVEATPATFMVTSPDDVEVSTSCDTPNNSCLGDVLDGNEKMLLSTTRTSKAHFKLN